MKTRGASRPSELKPRQLASLVLPLACAGFAGGAEQQAAVDQSLDAKIRTALDAVRENNGYPGLTVAFILPDDRVLSFSSGFDDVESEILMRPDSRLPSGSIGKSFVAAVGLALANDGKLSLDDGVSRWLGDEDWFERLEGADQITLRMLLTHSSGLPDYLLEADFLSAITPLFEEVEQNSDIYFNPQQLIGFRLDKPNPFAPGQGFLYSDTNYILAGLVIERAAGRPYYDELRSRFLEPLRLDKTEAAVGLKFADLAAGYISDDNPFGLAGMKAATGGVMLFRPDTEWTGGGLITNSVDLARWGKSLYEGSAMDGPYLEALLEGVDRDGAGQYGLGVYIDQTPLGIRYGHGGWFFGYVSRMSYYPDHGIAAAMQINVDSATDRDAMWAPLEDLVQLIVEASDEH